MQDYIINYLKKNNGVIKASDIRNAGYDNSILRRLEKSGELERVAYGLYIDPDIFADEYLIAQYRITKGVFSHDTALYFHDLSDRTPFKLTMTIPNGYNSRYLKDDNYQFFYCKKELYDIGITEINSPNGNLIKVYDKERTICDCIRKIDKLDSNLVLEAVKKYMSEVGNDYAKLIEYSKLFNVEQRVQQYMEVLL
jgi:predicted transcriptional regulator of viral defense system